MSRSGYSDYSEGWPLICWRGAVASASRGDRGQRLFREMLEALDAMEPKRLITSDLECSDGVCALGALGRARGIPMEGLDPYDRGGVADAFDVAEALAAEIVFMNDEWNDRASPEERWVRMRAWVASQIHEPAVQGESV